MIISKRNLVFTLVIELNKPVGNPAHLLPEELVNKLDTISENWDCMDHRVFYFYEVEAHNENVTTRALAQVFAEYDA